MNMYYFCGFPQPLLLTDVYRILLVAVIVGSNFCWKGSESSPVVMPNSKQTFWNSLTNLNSLLNEQQKLLRMTHGTSNYLAKFQGCFGRSGMMGNDWEVRAEYQFSVEGQDLAFNCGPCTPPSKTVFWRWITFEGVDSALKWKSKEDDNGSGEGEEDDDTFKPISYYHTEMQELVLTSPKPDLSSFYCYWEDINTMDGSKIRIISRIWTVEIVSMAHAEKFSARSWRKKSKQTDWVKDRILPIDLTLAETNIRVETQWSEWSPCSQCGITGKRYKTGFCAVGTPISPPTTTALKALKLFHLPISCSLLIDFHPDVLSESPVLQSFSRLKTLNHVFGRPPVILLGYCKTHRDCFAEGPLKNRVIAELFQDFEMKGGKDEREQDGGGSWSARRVLWLMKSLLHGVPLGWNNLPEMFALGGLVGLEVYVLYLICKWKSEAK